MPCIPPISRLPNEILILILEFAKQAMETRISKLHFNSTPAGITSHPWLALTLVCQRWRTLILNTQSFWRTIEFCSFRATQVLLERSGGASIEVGYSDNFLEPQSPEREQILCLLFDNVERARSLWFFGPCARRFLQTVAPVHDAPALEVLRLQLNDTSETLCDNFISDTSKLRRVELGGINVLPSSRVFASNVTSLSLNSLSTLNFERFSFATMFSILQKMPQLEELALDDMLHDSDGGTCEPLCLPRLKTFRFNTHSLAQNGRFMQYLELPSSTCIFCRVRCLRREDAVSSLSALVHPRPFSRFHVSYTGAEIGLYGHSETPQHPDDTTGSFSLHVQVQFMRPFHIPVILSNLLSLLSPSLARVRRLTVGACDSRTGFDWAPLLTRFAAVTELSVRGACAKWSLFVPALTYPVPVPVPVSVREGPQFLCPRLRVLGFVQCTCSWHTCARSRLDPEFPQRIAAALEMRRAQSGAQSRIVVRLTVGGETVRVGKVKRGDWGLIEV
ncbi:hypothetical protein DENSPDRAFT_613546 [Dentipellis sp. KUC8613]|nr:hypothetical protein DENSPDRAFT_613546 [Dentipellis sp. KUC8613]